MSRLEDHLKDIARQLEQEDAAKRIQPVVTELELIAAQTGVSGVGGDRIAHEAAMRALTALRELFPLASFKYSGGKSEAR